MNQKRMVLLIGILVCATASLTPPSNSEHAPKSQGDAKIGQQGRPVLTAHDSPTKAAKKKFLEDLKASRYSSHHLLAHLISSNEKYEKQVAQIIADVADFQERAERIQSEVFVAKCPFQNNLSGKQNITVDNRVIGITNIGFFGYANALGLANEDLKKKRILDVGAGFSSFTDISREYFDSETYAIDLSYTSTSPSALNGGEPLSPECRKLFDRYHFAMDAQNIRFPDNFFDLVVSNKFFYFFFVGFDPAKEHVDTGFRILEEMLRTTAIGGEIRASDFPSPEKIKKDLIDFPRKKDVSQVADYYEKKMAEFLKKHDGAISIEFPSENSKGMGMTRIRKLRKGD